MLLGVIISIRKNGLAQINAEAVAIAQRYVHAS